MDDQDQLGKDVEHTDEEVEERERINILLINPFRGKAHDDMLALVDDFAQATGLGLREERELFEKAAFLAQHPQAFESNHHREDGLTLTSEERRAIERERGRKRFDRWDQPFLLYALVACCSLGAAVQGWDETAVNQAQIYFPKSLNIPGVPEVFQGNDAKTTPNILIGLINSAPYLCCAVAGTWLTDPVNYFIGRRGAIFLACVISCITCIWQAACNSWQNLFVARFFLGLGIGLKSATIPVFASECAPKQIRGALVMMWQMWTAFGIMLGYLSGVVFQNVDKYWRWRLIIGSPMALPVIVCAYVYVLPESPRWLLGKARKGRTDCYKKAFTSLCRLRGAKIQAARDMFLIYHQLKNEEEISQRRNRFVDLFKVPRNRRAVVASLIVMFFQQFCGVNVFEYYSSLIFVKAGFTQKRATQVSAGFGIINFVFALPAVPIIDTFGRRNLLLVTFPFMAIFQLMTGLGFLAPPNSAARKTVVVIGMYMFCVAYSPGEGPVPFVYSSESMPLYVRDLGMSLFTAVTWFFNFLLAITFPKFLNAFHLEGAFAYYAAWCIVGFFAILLFVPETRGQSLEELDARFNIKTRTHAKYGLRQLRYVVCHHFLRRRLEKPRLQIEFTDTSHAATMTELEPWDFSRRRRSGQPQSNHTPEDVTTEVYVTKEK